jgi:L-rhamnose mutarotase
MVSSSSAATLFGAGLVAGLALAAAWSTWTSTKKRQKKLRRAFAMAVFAGKEEEYEQRHSPIWKELEDELRAHGASNYSIFLHEETRQLFGVVEIDDESRWQAIASTDVCKRWWKSMAPLMPSNPDSSPVSVSLREVFHMD